jgi:hypothetical protein
MNKTKMASVLAVALALALVTGCASSSSSKEAQKEAQQRREQERAELAEGAAKAKPLSFWTTVPYDSLWYSIQHAENNIAIVSTVGLYTYLEARDSNMNLIARNTNDQGFSPDGDRAAPLEFPVEAGKTYYVTSKQATRNTTIRAELKVPIGTLTDGESMIKNGVTISYSDGLIIMENNSGKTARVRYRHEPVVSASPTTTNVTSTNRRARDMAITTTTRTTGGTMTLDAGATDETRPSWDNPPKETNIFEVVLIEPEDQ